MNTRLVACLGSIEVAVLRSAPHHFAINHPEVGAARFPSRKKLERYLRNRGWTLQERPVDLSHPFDPDVFELVGAWEIWNEVYKVDQEHVDRVGLDWRVVGVATDHSYALVVRA